MINVLNIFKLGLFLIVYYSNIFKMEVWKNKKIKKNMKNMRWKD